MAVVFTGHLQLGTQVPPYVFETDLVEMTRRLGRPLPEVKGGRIHLQLDREHAWLVVCTLRGPVVPPLIDELTIEVVERTWVDRLMRVSQEAIGRLAYHHRTFFAGSHYQYYGQRDAEGDPRAVPDHPEFWRHFQEMKYLLHCTQTYPDRVRIRCDTRGAELTSIQAELQTSQMFRRRLSRRKKALRLANEHLRA